MTLAQARNGSLVASLLHMYWDWDIQEFLKLTNLAAISIDNTNVGIESMMQRKKMAKMATRSKD